MAKSGDKTMTKQRIFPFMVNGQFWKEIEVSEEDIKKGHTVVYVIEKADIFNNSAMTNVKRVIFQLCELAETANDYVARWFVGFWITDNRLYIEDGSLYTR